MNSAEKIQISLSAMAEMLHYDLSNPGRETAGLLIGEEIDGVVYVDHIRVGDQRGNPVHVEISDEELTNAVIEVSAREDGKVIVGWWHTHPGLSAFLSPTDIKTQSHYQALMPNAVSIVIDDIKFSKTHKFEDLDFGVFRVVNNKAQRLEYSIKDSVEFGLKSFLSNDGLMELRVENTTNKPVYYVPGMNLEKLNKLKNKLNRQSMELDDGDRNALVGWIELAESIEDGSIKEVPVDSKNLLNELDQSLVDINDTVDDINEILFNQEAQKSLIAIILTVMLEFIIFTSLL